MFVDLNWKGKVYKIHLNVPHKDVLRPQRQTLAGVEIKPSRLWRCASVKLLWTEHRSSQQSTRLRDVYQIMWNTRLQMTPGHAWTKPQKAHYFQSILFFFLNSAKSKSKVTKNKFLKLTHTNTQTSEKMELKQSCWGQKDIPPQNLQDSRSWRRQEIALYILHAWSGERKASRRREVLVCNCGCGVWLCGRSEQSCHVAFPFRSHLLGGKHLFVRLPRTVTAWQPRSHQRDGQSEKREKWVFIASVWLFFVVFFFSLLLCVLMRTFFVCSFVCLRVCERWKFNENNW